MAGELWRSYTQAAVEVTYGTAVQPATRRMYYEEPKFTLTRQPRPHMFATADRQNTRSLTIGPQEVAGTLKQPLSADEIIELLLMGVASGVTPTQPNAGTDPTVYLWTFTPSSAATPLNSASFEYHDGANPWLVSGCLVDQLNIKGSANGPADVTATMFGKALATTTMTAGLSQRTPSIIEGWESRIFVNAFGGTPGTTEVDGFLVNYDITIRNNLARKYLASDSNALAAAPTGAIGVEAVLTIEAATGQALTEFADWNVALATPTDRLIRLQFGANDVISHAYTKQVTVDIPGSWSAYLLGESDAQTRVYRLTLSAIYDPTNVFALQVRAQNTRSAAW